MPANVLKNIVKFTTLVVGVPQTLPHLLVAQAENGSATGIIPDLIAMNKAGFTVTATATDVTVTRTSSALVDAVDVYLEHWHTIEAATPVTPGFFAPPFVPFIIEGDAAPAAGTGAPDVAMFYGTTAGTGMFGEATDYAATVAVQTAAGTGRVPFPNAGPATAGASTTNTSSTLKTLTKTGIYRVSWQVGFDETSQLQVAINDVGVDNTTTLSGAGTQQNSNSVLISAVADDTLSIINPPGNPAALTVSPAAGLTHAQAPSLIVEYLGA